MNIFFLIIPIILLLLIGLYVIFFLNRIISLISGKRKNTNLFITLAIFILLILVGIYFWKFTTAIIILHLFIFAVLAQIINCIVRRVSSSESLKVKVQTIYNTGILPIILTLVVCLGGYYNMVNIIETDYTISSDKLNSNSSFKLAMISDTHFGNAINADDLSKYVNQIESEKPDALLLVGDIFDENTSKDDMLKASKILGQVKTKNGVFFVYGNHDKSTYGGNPNYSEDELESSLKASNIQVMKDQIIDLGKYVLIGRMDKSGDLHKAPRQDLNSLMKSIDKNKYIINLDHQPQDTLSAAKLGVDLQLSGHTHGGQIWPAAGLNNIFHFNDYEYGLETIDNFNIIVSSGMSGWGTPIRTQPHSEYVIITIIGTK